MILLQILRGALLGGGGLALGNAIALSYERGHEGVTYLGWYLLASLLLLAGVLVWLEIHRRQQRLQWRPPWLRRSQKKNCEPGERRSSMGSRSPEPEATHKWKPLADKLDDMIRDGMAMRQELEAPVEPEETSPGTWLVAGDVPEGWWEKVDEFDQRIRDLLKAERPALLATYAEGHNLSARELREANESRASPTHHPDARSNPQKMLDFANATREGPMVNMDCILDGLGAARRQLGLEHE